MKKAKKNLNNIRNKRNKLSQKLTSVNPDLNHEQTEEESHFGGIPDRDLKKNLGCG